MRHRLLARWPEGPGHRLVGEHTLVSACGEFAVVVTSRSRVLRGTRLVVRCRGQESPPFRAVLGPQGSLDGRHFAYGACIARGRWIVFIDGEAAADTFDEVGPPSFAPDGTRVAWRARLSDRWHLVLDGRAGPPFAAIVQITFAPRGDRAAYVGVLRGGDQFVVVNGWILASSWGEVRLLTFDRDGRRLAYAARAGDTWFVMEDGMVRATCEEVRSIDYLSDGRLACSVRRGGRWWLEVGGERRFGPYDDLVGTFTHEALPRFAFAASVRGRERIVIDGVEGPEFDRVWFSGFSADGRAAYIGRGGSGECVVLDGRPGRAFDAVGDLRFRPDGGALAYVATSAGRDRPAIIERPALTLGRSYDHVRSLRWSAGGEALAFVATQPTCRRVVVGDVEGGPHDMVDAPLLSPDGATVAYVAIDCGRRFLVIDEEAHGPFDEVWPPRIGEDGRSVMFATRIRTEIRWHTVASGSV